MRPTAHAPYAVTMWDFSWLERRYPGGGYEDWDLALGKLAERGYDAVRIDAYPHLIHVDGSRTWELLPAWDQQAWGAQSIVHVEVLPALVEFVRAARRHGIGVALSSWFREDRDNVRMAIRTPDDLGRVWLSTLRALEAGGVLDNILYVDLCNEFPVTVWAPWAYTDRVARALARGSEPSGTFEELAGPQLSRTDASTVDWMAGSIAVLREHYPALDYTFSFCNELPTWSQQDVSALDVLELHVWMANNELTDYYDRVGYRFERFSSAGYENVVAHGRTEYERDPQRYDDALFRTIDTAADWSRATNLGLWTTECWALVDYKDWPGLEWDWILDLNARAVDRALATGRWVGMATSNFCGPQFVGMWREVAWHQRLTTAIKKAAIDPDLSR
jgi:hypothetical protein